MIHMQNQHDFPSSKERGKVSARCCNSPHCAKCLLVACKNDDCPTHTLDLKIKQFAYRVSGYKHEDESEEKKQLEKELERLRSIRKN